MKGIKVLIIDGNPVTSKVMSHVLQVLPIEIWESNTANKARKLAQEIQPDLVLLDIVLPEICGYQLAQEFRENPKTRDCFIIFTTAREFMDDLEFGFEMAAMDYIRKPIHFSELIIRVRAAINLLAIHRKLVADAKMHGVLATVGSIAHNFNQPLTASRLATQLIDRKIKKLNLEKEFQDQVEIVERSLVRISELVKEFEGLKDFKTTSYATGEQIIDLAGDSKQKRD